MIPIILCGGSGTRLWPLINQKVFYKLTKEQSLLEMTLDRLKKFKAPLIISVEDHKTILEKTLKKHKNIQIIYEPLAKNTAASIALACFLLQKNHKSKELIGIFPADHYIDKKSKFQNLLAKAVKTAKKENKIVTFGIPPTQASSSYGYIQAGNKLKKSDVFKAAAFIEKPNTAQAKTLIKRGSLWNSGIFISPVHLLIHYFEAWLPNLWDEIKKIQFEASSPPFYTPSKHKSPQALIEEKQLKQTQPIESKNIHSIYKKIKAVSFDTGIMENIEDYLCIPCDAGWTDLGSWEKISEWNQKFPGKLNNPAKTFEKNSKGNFVFSTKEKSFALAGIKNQIIINAEGGLLIADKKHMKNIDVIRKTVHKKQTKDTNAANSSKKKQRLWIKKPWGAYQVLMEQKFLKYKKLKVNPKSQLSYQSHNKRAEHWIILEGQAEVTIADKIKKLKLNEHIFIDRGIKHRLKNPAKQTLLVLEVQIGHCLEEDITRYKDDYGRV